MPIYEYRCEACGHLHDALQRLADEPLRDCPECAEPRLKRLISKPSFRLKGSGWYETDFKSDKEQRRNLAETGGGSEAGGDKETGGDGAASSKDTAKDGSKGEGKDGSRPDGGASAKPESQPSPKSDRKPNGSSAGSKSSSSNSSGSRSPGSKSSSSKSSGSGSEAA